MGANICCDEDVSHSILSDDHSMLHLYTDKLQIQFNMDNNNGYKLIYQNNGNVFYDNKLELYGDDLIIFKTPLSERIILSKDKNQWSIFIHRNNVLTHKSLINTLINNL